MVTVDGLTKARMLEIEAASVIGGSVNLEGRLILQTRGGATFDAGSVLGFAPTGSVTPFAGSAAPNGWLLCDGSAVSRTTYADLFLVIGTTYGVGDNSTTFNLPNLKGRVTVGLDSAQTEFNAVGKTGGAKTVTLALTEIPGHTHSTPAHTHSVTVTDPGHTHSVDPPSTTTSSDSHSHTVSGTTGTTGLTAILASVSDGASGSTRVKAGSDSTGRYDMSLGGSSHNHSFSATTSSDAHTHTLNIAAFNSASSDTGITATVPSGGAGTSGSAGGGGAHNNLQPYITMNHIIKI